MLKAYLLRFHRWISVVFALPLAFLIITGFILALQPMVQSVAVKPGSVTLQQIEGYFAKHDPEGKTRALRLNSYDNVLTMSGVGPDGSVDIDLKNGEEAGDDSFLTSLFQSARPLHEHLVGGLSWLVPLSTAAMLLVMGLGVLMGLPRINNSASGWHKATAWFLLPLLVLSPLTGLFMTYRISFDTPAPRLQPAPMIEAVRMIAQKHDLSGLAWIRSRGGAQMARVNDGNSTYTYLVGKDGLKPAPANLPRTFHEGTFLGMWGGVMNVVISLALALLLGTGLYIWLKRSLRRRTRTRRAPGPSTAAA